MPYPPEHKSRTHGRIVGVASRLFRAEGYQATGVDKLMSAAGLTRGGFYAHFRDKGALLVEALELAFDESTENLFARGHESLSGEDWLRRAAKRYLSPEHVADPGAGCAVPTLGAEVARAPASVKRAFARRIARLVDTMADRLGGGRRARKRALGVLSTWVGAVVLSRAVGDEKLASEILSAARAATDSVEAAGRRPELT